MQDDWVNYGESFFEFKVLYIGSDWILKETRLAKEAELLEQDMARCYNVFKTFEARLRWFGEKNGFFGRKHSEKTLEIRQQSCPCDLLKKVFRMLNWQRSCQDNLGSVLEINGKRYPSIAQASRSLGHARKTIRARLSCLTLKIFQSGKELLIVKCLTTIPLGVGEMRTPKRRVPFFFISSQSIFE